MVTLIEQPHSICEGVAYLVDSSVLAETFENLDYREKNGYSRHEVTLHTHNNSEATLDGVVYIAVPGNFAYLGEAPLPIIAKQIRDSVGPSGKNSEYLLNLAAALRKLECHDEHVFQLESCLKEIM